MRRRYVEIRGEFGGPAGPQHPAFAEPGGAALRPETLAQYLRDLRRVRINAEFNANMCRALLQTRLGGNEARSGTQAGIVTGGE